MNRIVVVAECDWRDCGKSEEVLPLDFGYLGSAYQADLCPDHLESFAADLSQLAAVARKAGTKRPASRTVKDMKEVRVWAASHGMTVASKGRVPLSVIEAYVAAVA